MFILYNKACFKIHCDKIHPLNFLCAFVISCANVLNTYSLHFGGTLYKIFCSIGGGGGGGGGVDNRGSDNKLSARIFSNFMNSKLTFVDSVTHITSPPPRLSKSDKGIYISSTRSTSHDGT